MILDQFRLDGKTALVTCCKRGIGLAMAETFIKAVSPFMAGGMLPPVLDVEDPAENLTVAQYIDRIGRWISAVERAFGVTPIIYTANWYWNTPATLNNTTAFSRLPDACPNAREMPLPVG